MAPSHHEAARSLAGKAAHVKGHLEETAGDLVRDAGRQASARVDDAKGAAHDALGWAERQATELGKNISDAATNVRSQARDMMDDVDLASVRGSVERQVRANSVRALLIAGALGLLVGRFLLPKRD